MSFHQSSFIRAREIEQRVDVPVWHGGGPEFKFCCFMASPGQALPPWGPICHTTRPCTMWSARGPQTPLGRPCTQKRNLQHLIWFGAFKNSCLRKCFLQPILDIPNKYNSFWVNSLLRIFELNLFLTVTNKKSSYMKRNEVISPFHNVNENISIMYCCVSFYNEDYQDLFTLWKLILSKEL